METYVSKYTGKQIDEAVDLISTGLPKPDLSQNDPNAADYVKNRTHWVEINESVLTEQTVSNDNAAFTTSFDIIIGETYIVEFDGVKYELVGFDDDGFNTLGAPYGDWSEYPFQLFNGEGLFFYGMDSNEHTIKVIKAFESIHKLDEKFLPDTIARTEDVETALIVSQSDWNEGDKSDSNYIKNRTHWTDFESSDIFNVSAIEWTVGDGTVYKKITDYNEGLSTFAIDGVTWKLIFDEDEYEGTLKNKSLEFYDNDGVQVALVVPWGDYYYLYDYYYLNGYSSTPRTSARLIKRVPTTVHKLDEKYIPDSIPKVQTAIVGQTVVVKAVDENGKPTEWETADMGGGSAPIVYILDKSGDGTVYSCSVDFETARAKRFSVPVYVKIIKSKYEVYEAFKVYTNGDDSIVEVSYEYDILGQGYSGFFIHDADGVHNAEEA